MIFLSLLIIINNRNKVVIADKLPSFFSANKKMASVVFNWPFGCVTRDEANSYTFYGRFKEIGVLEVEMSLK